MDTQYLAPPKIESFRIVVPKDLVMKVLSDLFWMTQYPDMTDSLVINGRLLRSYHVTLIRHSDQYDARDTWKEYSDLYLGRFKALNEQSSSADYAQYVVALEAHDPKDRDALRESETLASEHKRPRDAPSLDMAGIKFKAIVWDGRVMAIAVDLQPRWVREPWGLHDEASPCIHRCAHIALGTADSSIHIDERTALVERWLELIETKGDNTEDDESKGDDESQQADQSEGDDKSDNAIKGHASQSKSDERKEKLWFVDISKWFGDLIPGDIRPVLSPRLVNAVPDDGVICFAPKKFIKTSPRHIDKPTHSFAGSTFSARSWTTAIFNTITIIRKTSCARLSNTGVL